MSSTFKSVAVFVFICLCLITSAVDGSTNGTNSMTNGGLNPYPNPWQDPEQCGSSKEEPWICDVDDVLLPETAKTVNTLLISINANASCVCNCSKSETSSEGYVMAVAVVRTLPHEDLCKSNQTYKLQQFSDAVRKDWFDDRVCDDNALIVANKNYSKIFISLGDDLAALLPDKALPLIETKIQPSLDEGDLGQALLTTIQELSAAIATAQQNYTPKNNLVWGILGVIAVSTILLFHYWIKY